jgi:predicted O-linked N-acetylglucosamine transferase (SPINDLY family)
MAGKLFDWLKRGSTQPVHSPADEGQLAQAALALKSGDLEGAVRLYDAVLERQGGHAEAHYKRANALNGLGRWELALAGYERAIELKPDYAHAFCNRGTVLERLRRWEDALSSYDRAAALDPRDYFAHYNRGSVLKELRRFEEALASYERALSLKSDYAEAHINRGHVLQELLRHEAAVASYDQGIELNPQYAEAFLARGNSLSALHRHEEAMASFDRALRLDPERKFLLGLRRAEQMHICDWSGLAAELESLAQAIQAGRRACPPFVTLALFDSPSLHRLAAETWMKEECPPDRHLGDIVARKRDGKIKIGYFSADFREHPVARLTAELFEAHDLSRFDITAFAFGPGANDAMRNRLESAFDRFIDVRSRSDIEVAALAREIGIDVAVDLGGYTQYNRTKIFASRAAPIQLSYVGYLGTMAAPYMDYLLADKTIIPAGSLAEYSEKIIWLPSYQVNDSQRRISERQFTRAELGLPAAGFVFCCLNGTYKILPNTFAAWMRILRRVPSSCLFLYANDSVAEANLRAAAGLAGVGPDRLVFGKRVAVEDYLARYRALDLFLDTLPYNAGTTASDALWAGLPVLTCKGQSFPARYAASLLNAVGMPELIANTMEEYEELAVQLAADSARMELLRRKLANNRTSTQLFDTPRFARSLESAYVRIYERYHEGLPPDHISCEG